MKTNVLLTLLLAVSIAFVAGCPEKNEDPPKSQPETKPAPKTAPAPAPSPKPASWQSKISGEYPGMISNTVAGEEYPSKTVFKVEGDKISGTFELDVNGMVYSGVLEKFTIVGDRKFKCRWRNDEQREGDFSGTFSQDLSSFEGKWAPDDQDGDGDWKGKKAPPKPAPTTQPTAAAGWQSKIAGEYPGTITNAGEEFPSKTTFKIEGDKISGAYELDVNGMQYSGALSKFTIVDELKFKCRWRDDEEREGNLTGTFAPDLLSFEAQWDSDDEGGDGDWKGKKGQ